jgi:hypothetical protein
MKRGPLTDKARIEFQQRVASQGVGWERMAYQEILSLDEALVEALRERDFATQQWRDWNARTNRAEKRLSALEDCAECLNHALEMGHFTPGGSTEGWARKAIKTYRERSDG